MSCLKHFAPLVLILYCSCSAGSGSGVDALEWAVQAGGTGSDMAWSVATAQDDSVVITGYFNRDATFGPGETNETVLSSAGGDNTLGDFFLASYNTDGTLAWAKRAGGVELEVGMGVAVVADGSILVTGVYHDQAVFGDGELNQTTLAPVDDSQYEPDIFIARYNPDGSLDWVTAAGGQDNEVAWAIAGLPDGASLVAGTFIGSAVFGIGESGETELTAYDGEEDIFVARYRPDGTLLWAISAGGSSFDRPRGLSVSPDGSFAICGDFTADAVFGKGELGETNINVTGELGLYVAMFKPDGSLDWVRSGGPMDSTNSCADVQIMTDGSVAVAGWYRQIMTLGSGGPNQTMLTSEDEMDVFIAKYSSAGELQWAKSAGGVNDDSGWSMAELPDGSLALTGYVSDSAKFGASEKNETKFDVPPFNSKAVFAASYDPNGLLLWASRQGGNHSNATGLSAAPLSDGSFVVSGRFIEGFTFGSGGANQGSFDSFGEMDVLLLRFLQ